MQHNIIIDEIHKYRAEYARQFNYNVKDICLDMQKKQNENKQTLVSFPQRQPVIVANAV